MIRPGDSIDIRFDWIWVWTRRGYKPAEPPTGQQPNQTNDHREQPTQGAPTQGAPRSTNRDAPPGGLMPPAGGAGDPRPRQCGCRRKRGALHGRDVELQILPQTIALPSARYLDKLPAAAGQNATGRPPNGQKRFAIQPTIGQKKQSSGTSSGRTGSTTR